MKRLRTGELTAANISNRSVDHGVSGRGVPITVMVMVLVMMAVALLVSNVINRGAIDDASSSASRTTLEALV